MQNHFPYRLAPALGVLGSFLLILAPADGAAFRLDSNAIAPGDSWAFRFETTGAYSYYCTPHPWMKGTVRIETGAPPTAAAVNVTVESFGFHPPEILAPVGALINWTNRDDVIHTVTQRDPAPLGGIQKWQVVVGIASLLGISLIMARLLRGAPKPPA